MLWHKYISNQDLEVGTTKIILENQTDIYIFGQYHKYLQKYSLSIIDTIQT